MTRVYSFNERGLRGNIFGEGIGFVPATLFENGTWMIGDVSLLQRKLKLSDIVKSFD